MLPSGDSGSRAEELLALVGRALGLPGGLRESILPEVRRHVSILKTAKARAAVIGMWLNTNDEKLALAISALLETFEGVRNHAVAPVDAEWEDGPRDVGMYVRTVWHGRPPHPRVPLSRDIVFVDRPTSDGALMFRSLQSTAPTSVWLPATPSDGVLWAVLPRERPA